jgi:hypothetical protein
MKVLELFASVRTCNVLLKRKKNVYPLLTRQVLSKWCQNIVTHLWKFMSEEKEIILKILIAPVTNHTPTVTSFNGTQSVYFICSYFL